MNNAEPTFQHEQLELSVNVNLSSSDTEIYHKSSAINHYTLPFQGVYYNVWLWLFLTWIFCSSLGYIYKMWWRRGVVVASLVSINKV